MHIYLCEVILEICSRFSMLLHYDKYEMARSQIETIMCRLTVSAY